VLLAAGNPLHGGISGKGLLKRNLLVRSRSFHFPVGDEARWSNVFVAVHAVHGGVLFPASIALHYPIDISLVRLRGLDQGVDEGIAGVRPNSADSGKSERSLALVTAEARRLGQRSELLDFETGNAKGMQAGKGAGVIEGPLTHRALGQLLNCDRV